MIRFSCFFKAVLDWNSFGWIFHKFIQIHHQPEEYLNKSSKRCQCSIQNVILKFAQSISVLQHIKAASPQRPDFQVLNKPRYSPVYQESIHESETLIYLNTNLWHKFYLHTVHYQCCTTDILAYLQGWFHLSFLNYCLYKVSLRKS